MTAQTTSTTPNGHAPATKPYTHARQHPSANASTKLGPRASNAYIVIMNVSARTPYRVSTCRYCPLGLRAYRGGGDGSVPLTAKPTADTTRARRGGLVPFIAR